MRFQPFGWMHKSLRHHRQAEILTEFKPVTTLPKGVPITEEDIPWAIIVEDEPTGEISRAPQLLDGRLAGVPPMPVLIILPILIALLAFTLSE